MKGGSEKDSGLIKKRNKRNRRKRLVYNENNTAVPSIITS